MRSDDIRFLWKFERRWKELKDLALIPKRNRERTELFRRRWPIRTSRWIRFEVTVLILARAG
jgi:hypothetical protein